MERLSKSAMVWALLVGIILLPGSLGAQYISELHSFSGQIANENFGQRIAGVGDVNGDLRDDFLVGTQNSGRAYLFFGGPELSDTPDLVLSEVTPGFGQNVSGAGDVNGDGYADFLVASPQFSGSRGRVYLYFGGETVDDDPDMTFDGSTNMGFFGNAMAALGDVNGDERDDIIIAEPGYSDWRGKASVYFGNTLMDDSPDQTWQGGASYESFAQSVAGPGDVNNDGYADILIGASSAGGEGRAYIFLGGTSLSDTPDITFSGSTAKGRPQSAQTAVFGGFVAGVGDINNDGYSDILASGLGFVDIYFGGDPMDTERELRISGSGEEIPAGCSAGDANRDGYGDLVIGEGRYNGDVGRIRIFLGGSDFDSTPDQTITGESAGGYFGMNVVFGDNIITSNLGREIVVTEPGAASGDGRGRIFGLEDECECGAGFEVNPTVYCKGDTIQFWDRSVGDVVSWHWGFGDGQESNQQNPQHTYNIAPNDTGIFTISLQVGCIDQGYSSVSVQDLINVKHPLAPNFGFWEGGYFHCDSITICFQDSTVPRDDVEQWIWDFDDDSSMAIGPYAEHTYKESGTYDVKLTVINVCDTFPPFTKPVIVEVPGKPEAKIGILKTQENENCEDPDSPGCDCTDPGDSVVVVQCDFLRFCDLTDSSNAKMRWWAWDFTSDGSFDSHEKNPDTSVYFNDLGTFYTTLIDSNQCGPDTAILKIVVEPSSPDEKPDLVIDSLSIGECSKAVVVNVRNKQHCAENVTVRLQEENISGGGGGMRTVGTFTIPERLGTDKEYPVTFSGYKPWAPRVKLHAEVDYTKAIDEEDENNNILSEEFSNSPPTINDVTAQWDGLTSNDEIGTFITTITAQNRMTANVTDLDGEDDLEKVEFTLGGQTIVDSDPSGGWSATFNMGTLSAGTHQLVVTVYDCWEQTDTKALNVKVFPFPDWVPIEYQAWFDGGEGVYHVQIPMPPGIDWEYDNVLPADIIGFGGEDNSQGTDFTLEMEGSVDGVYGIGASGSAETEILGIDFGAEYSFMGQIQIADAVLFKGANGNLIISFNKDFPAIPLARYPIVPGVVTAKIDFSFSIFGQGALYITLDEDLDFVPQTSFTATLSPSVNIIGEVEVLFGIAGAQLIASPTLTFVMPIEYTTAEGVTVNFSLSFSIPWRAVAYFLFWEGEVASGELGPWTFIDTERELWMEGIDGTIATLPELPGMPPHPSIDTSPLGTAVAVWVGPSISANAIFFSFWDGGQWSAEMELSANDVGVNDPQVKFTPNGYNAVAVWTQAKAGASLGPGSSIETTISALEIYYSFYSAGGGWSAPQPITDNTLGDGRASLDVHTENDILAVWTHASDTDWHTRSDWEIHYSHWSGSSWTTPAAIPGTDDGDADCAVDVAYASDGSAVAVWMHNENTIGDTTDFNRPEDLFLQYSIWNGSSWGTIKTYDPAPNLVADPDVAFSESGIGVLAWQEIESYDDTLYNYMIAAAFYNDGTETWGTPEIAAQSFQMVEKPILSTFTDPEHDLAIIVYRGYKERDDEIFAVVKDLTNLQSPWTEPVALTSDTLTDWMAAMGIDEAMNIMLLNGKLNMWPGSAQTKAGNFAEGLQFTMKGIGSDLSITDDLNFAQSSLLPDLSIQSEGIIFRTPSGEPLLFPGDGDPVVIRVEVENIGRTASGSFRVLCYDGDPSSFASEVIADYNINGIDPDGSSIQEFDWIASPGTHEIHVEVDPDNDVVEALESNNTAFASIHIAADLTVTNILFTNENPLVDEVITVEATIVNIGEDDIDDFNVRFYNGHPDSSATTPLGDYVPISHLSVGEETTVPFDFSAPEGITDVYAFVDPDNNFIERDEENNLGYAALYVLPDLKSFSDSLAVYDQGGNQFEIILTAQNAGGVDASDICVIFYDGDPLLDGVIVGDDPPLEINPIDSVTIPALPAGQAWESAVSWTAPCGLSEVYAVIDPYDSITERDENNNKATGKLISYAPADLFLEASDISFSDPNPAQGDDVIIYVTFHNDGVRPVHFTRVVAYDGYPSAENVPVGEIIAVLIAGNSSAEIEILWKEIALPGNREVYIWIDPDGEQVETNIDNNVAFQILSVEAGMIGDVDNSGTINVLDALRVINIILGLGGPPTEFELFMGDCTQDGNINVLDVLGIVNIILGIGTCPPAGNVAIAKETMEYLESLADYLAPVHYNQLMALVKEVQVPERFALAQNYPNPFNPKTDIRYQITESRYPFHTTLKIYNILGQEVRTLVNEPQEAGYYTVTWDGRDSSGQGVSSGVYFYRLKAGEFTATKRMVLLK